MKKYRFYITICLLIILYIFLVIFKPKQVDWTITLEKKDKNPYGAYILFHQLKNIYPEAKIFSDQLPVYNQLADSLLQNTAYLLIAPEVNLHKEDVHRLMQYIRSGNSVFIAAYGVGAALGDTLHLDMSGPVHDIFRKDSAVVNFTNPLIRSDSGYYFRKYTIDGYFTKIDTTHARVLGVLDNAKPNFLRMKFGKGCLYVHAAPLCFSNYFMLFKDNDRYTASALSYLPKDVKAVYWDEYYKSGPEFTQNVMSYVLTHTFLKWAWYIAVFILIVYLLFDSKRRQRIIPEIDVMRNASLDFAKLVGNVYFNQRDNKNIAEKKISYFLEYIRTHLYLSTHELNDGFVESLSEKSGVDKEEIKNLSDLILRIRMQGNVPDDILIRLNNLIDDFYKKVNHYGA